MTNTQKIKALESRVETLQAMVERLEGRLAILDVEHADTRLRVLARWQPQWIVPEDDDTQGSVVEIEATTKNNPPNTRDGRKTQGSNVTK